MVFLAPPAVLRASPDAASGWGVRRDVFTLDDPREWVVCGFGAQG
jgi:hypothetical protein